MTLEERLRQQQQQMALRGGIGGGGMPVQPVQPQQPGIGGGGTNVVQEQAPLSGAHQRELAKARKAPVRGGKAIMDATSPTALTALAKIGAAYYINKRGKKERGEDVSALEKSLRAEGEKEQKALDRTMDRENKTDALAERRVAAAEKARMGQPQAVKGEAGWQWFQSDDEGNTQEVEEMTGLSPEIANRLRTGTASKPPASEVKSYRTGNRLLKQFDRAASTFGGFNEEQLAMADQPGAEIALGMADKVLPEGTGRMISETSVFTDPDVRKYRTNVAKIESDFSRMMSGLAVTGYEMTDRKKWSPYAEGISQDERTQRLGSLRQEIEDDVDIFGEMYPAYSNAFDEADDDVVEEEISDAPEGVDSTVWNSYTKEQQDYLRQKLGGG